MFQSSSISLLAPQVNSVSTGTQTRKPVAATKINFAKKTTRKSFSFLKNIDIVPVLAVTAIVSLMFFLVMHVVWINVYSSKGFTLKNLQNSIDEQTTMQKKLLVQQSMLNSSLSLGEAGQNGLVPVTDVEHLAGNNLAQAR
jgi:uncharacterized membrane protein YvbJ